MRLRRYLPVIAGVVFALAFGSALFAWLLPPPAPDPWANEVALPPIPEQPPRKRRAPRPTPVPAAATVAAQDCAATPLADGPSTRPPDAQGTMLGPCPGGTPP